METELQNLKELTLALGLLIAAGLIIAGIIVLCWPVDTSGNMFVVAGALAKLVMVIFAAILGIPGMVLLFVIRISSSRDHTLATIGTWISFILAVTLIGGVLAMNIATGFDSEPTLITIGIIAGLGFLCAGLSALIRQRLLGYPIQDN